MPEEKQLEKKYGTRTVLGDSYYKPTPSGKKIKMILCECECGVKKYVQKWHLLSGASKNCGCLKAERLAEIGRNSAIHGMEGTHPYYKFMSAKSRCENPKNDSYYRYGGRGIKILWKNFEEFWNDMGESYNDHVKKFGKDNTTLDRINVDGDYCKENCRRATRLEQYNNMSTNRKVTYKGKEFPSISELCRHTGKNYRLVRDRIKAGWSVDDAIDLDLCKNSHDHNKAKR